MDCPILAANSVPEDYRPVNHGINGIRPDRGRDASRRSGAGRPLSVRALAQGPRLCIGRWPGRSPHREPGRCS